ncbi:MAG: hypothetical protein H8E56_01085 [Candidatus Marinimicrobia bacterium]|nr:hypothetical protein [Candidatus Neomarinimicrobiota bacterium]
MKKYESILIALILLGFVLSGCSPKEANKLNSSEYKLLLNSEKFDDYEAGFKNYWAIVKTVAKNNNVPIEESNIRFKLKHKEVSFYDTRGLDLRKSGFLIRQKVKYKDGHKKPGFEFGVKYRRSNPKDALSVDLTLAEGFTPKYDKIELESDVVYNAISKNGGRDIKYSVSNSIKLEESPEMTLGAFVKIYPALGAIEISPSTSLHLVAGVSADEWMVVPGKLDFGDGLFGRVDMTIWIIQTKNGELRIPEFSFDHPFLEDREYNKEAMKRCTDFIDELQKFQPDWVAPGALKAAYLFGDVE